MPKSRKASHKPSAFKTKVHGRTTAGQLLRAARAHSPNKELRKLMRSANNPWSDQNWNVTAQGSVVREFGLAAAKKIAARAGRKPGDIKRPVELRLDEREKAAADRDDIILTKSAGRDDVILIQAMTTAAERENNRLVQQSGAKPSNPKDALGIMKVPYSTIPATVLAELGIAMLEGALKYGRHNYRAIGVRASVYYDANVARHMALFWEGEDEDPDTCALAETDTGFYNGEGKSVIRGTGISHLTKAIAGLVVLRDAQIQGKFVDDRPPRTKAGWQNELNKKVKALLVKYPNAVKPYVEGDERMRHGNDS